MYYSSQIKKKSFLSSKVFKKPVFFKMAAIQSFICFRSKIFNWSYFLTKKYWLVFKERVNAVELVSWAD